MVSLTRSPNAVYADGQPVTKAHVRLLLNEQISAIDDKAEASALAGKADQSALQAQAQNLAGLSADFGAAVAPRSEYADTGAFLAEVADGGYGYVEDVLYRNVGGVATAVSLDELGRLREELAGLGGGDFGSLTSFLGEVSSTDLISGDDLAAALGLTAGTSQQSDAGWLRFFVPASAACNREGVGYFALVAKRPFRRLISYDDIDAVNAASGVAVQIGEKEYTCRLLSGAASDPAPSFDTSVTDGAGFESEWSELLVRAHTEIPTEADPNVGMTSRPADRHGGPQIGPNIASFEDGDLFTGDSYDGFGSGCWCLETDGSQTDRRITRGAEGVASYSSQKSNEDRPQEGWRPVLILPASLQDLFGSNGSGEAATTVSLLGSETAFLGEVSPTQLISGDDLAAAIGLSDGIAQQSDAGWLKYLVPAGATCNRTGEDYFAYVAKRPFRRKLSLNHIDAVGAVTGVPVEIGGKSYVCRLISGASANPSALSYGTSADDGAGVGSEWSELLLRSHSAVPSLTDINAGMTSSATSRHGGAQVGENFAAYGDADLFTGDSNDTRGSSCWCLEADGIRAGRQITRGAEGVASYSSQSFGLVRSNDGWRPVLVEPVSIVDLIEGLARQGSGFMSGVWHGAVTDQGFRVSCDLEGTNDVLARLVVSESADFANVVFSSQPISPTLRSGENAGEFWRSFIFEAEGLRAETEHWYAFEVGGELDTENTFRVKTLPRAGQAAAFKFAFSSCSRPEGNRSDLAFAAVQAETDLAFFIHLGDLTYLDPTVNDPPFLRANLQRRFKRNDAARAMIAETPMVYLPDDHDTGPNDTHWDKTFSDPETTFENMIRTIRSVYIETTPHYPLAQANGGKPTADMALAQVWDVGRARFIGMDTRTQRRYAVGERTALGTGENPPGSWDQRNWVLSQLEKAVDDPVDLVFLVSPCGWIGGVYDVWDQRFLEEARLICDTIRDTPEMPQVVLLCGDLHRGAVDDGSFVDLSTGGGMTMPGIMSSGMYENAALGSVSPWEWMGSSATFGADELYTVVEVSADGNWAATIKNGPYTDGVPVVEGVYSSTDQAPEISFAETSGSHAADSAVSLLVEKSFFGPIGGCSVDWSADDGQSGVASFGPNQGRVTIDVTAPSSGAITVTLSNPTGATVGGASYVLSVSG